MEQLQSRHGKLITLSWHLRSSIESTAGVQSMLDTYIFFSIWFPPCRKETNIHWNTTIILKEKCQENKHPFWNHQFKNLMNLSESILIYIIIVTYTYPPPFNPLHPYPCCHWERSTSPQVAWNLPQGQEGQLCWTKVDAAKVVWKPISARHGRDQRLYLCSRCCKFWDFFRLEMCWRMILVYSTTKIINIVMIL